MSKWCFRGEGKLGSTAQTRTFKSSREAQIIQAMLKFCTRRTEPGEGRGLSEGRDESA